MSSSPRTNPTGPDGSVLYDPLLPAFVEDPYPFYARLREESPVHFSPSGDGWVLSRYADAQMLLRDPRFGRSGFDSYVVGVLGPGPVERSFRRWMLFMDPPNHTRLRALASKAFTPRAVERLRAEIQRQVDLALDRIQQAGNADLIDALAYPLPVAVICELLGVPLTDLSTFHDWSDALARVLEIRYSPPEVVAAGNEAAQGLTDYFRDLVAERRGHLGDDLLSALIVAEEQGDRLNEEELLATCVLLFFAGHETTVNLIGNGMLALLRHPDQLRRLRENPTLIGSAIEEFLRYDGSVQRTARFALVDLKIHDIQIEKGQVISALLGAANRDPARFTEPDQLDLARSDNQHLTFGGGMHYCLGAPLARLEAQLAINGLVQRLPELELASDQLEHRPNSVLRGLRALPVRW
jgi:pimeloyl-[acyl-carrier protein] synthase